MLSQRRKKLLIEVEEGTAERLEALAAKSSRYLDANDAASDVVHLYLNLLEEVEAHMRGFRTRQLSREKRRIRPAPRARRGRGRRPDQAGARAAGSA